MNENELSHLIIKCALKVHSTLGPGLLESAYESCLHYELQKAGLNVEKQKPIPVVYDEIKLDCGFRADLMVEQKVVVEIKSIDAIADIHRAQVLTYLRFTQTKLGLLFNFNVLQLKTGIHRIVNKL